MFETKSSIPESVRQFSAASPAASTTDVSAPASSRPRWVLIAAGVGLLLILLLSGYVVLQNLSTPRAMQLAPTAAPAIAPTEAPSGPTLAGATAAGWTPAARDLELAPGTGYTFAGEQQDANCRVLLADDAAPWVDCAAIGVSYIEPAAPAAAPAPAAPAVRPQVRSDAPPPADPWAGNTPSRLVPSGPVTGSAAPAPAICPQPTRELEEQLCRGTRP